MRSRGRRLTRCTRADARCTTHSLACRSYAPKLVSVLLQAGADVNARTADGTQRTPLHIAVNAGQGELIAMLMKAGADAGLRDASGSTPRSAGLIGVLRAYRDRQTAGVDEAAYQAGAAARAAARAAEAEEWREKLAGEVYHGGAGGERSEADELRSADAFADAWQDAERRDADSMSAAAAEAAKRLFGSESTSSGGARAGSATGRMPRFVPEGTPASPKGRAGKAGTAGGGRAPPRPRSPKPSEMEARRAADEEAWAAFEAASKSNLTMDDVPWPYLGPAGAGGASSDAQQRYVVGIHPDMSLAEQRVRIRKAQRRWHPDKFVQKHGARVAESAQDAVMERVKVVAQAINSAADRIAAEIAAIEARS